MTTTLRTPTQKHLPDAFPNNNLDGSFPPLDGDMPLPEALFFNAQGNTLNDRRSPFNKQSFLTQHKHQPPLLEKERRRGWIDQHNHPKPPADATQQSISALSASAENGPHDQTELLQLQAILLQKNAELEQIKAELDTINTALRVLMQNQKADVCDIREMLELHINQEITPFLSQLKKSQQNAKQLALLNILEVNLQKLLSCTGQGSSPANAYQKLTPKEIQVASMIRQGFASKRIAATLSLSTETVNAHRKSIRKKLGLDNKAINLRIHLG